MISTAQHIWNLLTGNSTFAAYYFVDKALVAEQTFSITLDDGRGQKYSLTLMPLASMDATEISYEEGKL